MEENKNVNGNPEEKQPELAPEIKAVLEKDAENRKKLAEVFSQCWDDEKFKKEFMANPKKVMDEYDVAYDKSKDYVILDAKEKTFTAVLPYENVKDALEGISLAMKKVAEGTEGSKRIMPEGWSYEFIQNTVDTNYIVIPVNPEKLSPEELEMINGGCFFIAAVVVIVSVVAAAGVAVVAIAAVAVAAAVAGVAAVVTAGAILNIVVANNVGVIETMGFSDAGKGFGEFYGKI